MNYKGSYFGVSIAIWGSCDVTYSQIKETVKMESLITQLKTQYFDTLSFQNLNYRLSFGYSNHEKVLFDYLVRQIFCLLKT